MTHRQKLHLTGFFGLLGLIACGSDKTPGKNDPNNQNRDEPTVCPAGQLSVCQLKSPTATEKPAADSRLNLTQIVVSTPTVAVPGNETMPRRTGFYVQDINAANAGRYAGILVSYDASLTKTPPPSVGDVLVLEAVLRQRNITAEMTRTELEAIEWTVSGQSPVTPVVIDSATDIALGGKWATAYEGMLVALDDIAVSETNIPGLDVATKPDSRIFGFKVEGGLVVSTQLVAYRAFAGEKLTRLAGVLQIGTQAFNNGLPLLTPRFTADLVSSSPAQLRTSIQSLQNPAATDFPQHCRNVDGSKTEGRCVRAELDNVIVTAVGGYVSSKLRALFVQDPNTADGRFAGIKVVYSTEDMLTLPKVGDRIRLEGEAIEYRRSMQIQYPEFTIVSSNNDLPMITVPAETISRKLAPESNPYEGVLVQIENVAVTERCVNDETNRDRGNWLVTGDVLIGTSWFYAYNGGFPDSKLVCEENGQPTENCSCAANTRPGDQRTLGEEFNHIVGIVDFGFGDLRLNPRGDADIVRKVPLPVMNSIVAIQDAQHPNHLPSCKNLDGMGTEGVCLEADLNEVVVTAVGAFVSTNLRALYVQDPNIYDGRFAGIKVTYRADATGVPVVGDRIHLRGEVINYRGLYQIQQPSFEVLDSGVAVDALKVVVEPEWIGQSVTPESTPYEGVLVTLNGVEVEAACINDAEYRDFGYWLVTGNVLIGTAWSYDYNGSPRPSTVECFSNGEPTGACSCEANSRPGDQRTLGDTFESISGIVDYGFGLLRLEPRGNADLVRP